jgi:hypothetical protein
VCTIFDANLPQLRNGITELRASDPEQMHVSVHIPTLQDILSGSKAVEMKNSEAASRAT